MQPEVSIPGNQEAMIRRYPVVTYFALTFLISWSGALAVAAPHLIRHQPLPKITGLLMFPVMLLGPSLAGVLLTRIVDGKRGLGVLLSAIVRARVPAGWYAVLLIPPILVLTVLILLQRFVSPVYAPNRFFMGVLFGIPAGFLEEIGWTGYAFPKMLSAKDGLAASVILGLLWAFWHLPVINYLGTATPRGVYWLPFFLAFSLAMTAMRVLISWIYINTKSVLLAQLMHVSSTGSLVVFSAAGVTAAQEAMWYGLYGTALWVAVGIVVKIFGRRLRAAGNLGPQSD
jgi:membrane protease YdiL (CAAX protease family)